jgi:hypothetical protein
MTGFRKVFNYRWPDPSRDAAPEFDHARKVAWDILRRPEYWNPSDRAPDHVTLQENDRPAMPVADSPTTPEILGKVGAGFFSIDVPVLRFNDLFAVERDEIERFSAIANLMRSYARSKEKKPLSIAVFGPPGSGKSFAVTQLAHTVIHDLEPIVINLSQLKSPEELMKALTDVPKKEMIKDGQCSLVFFDEFDSQLDGTKLGWLKYFLAPMQDGKCRYEGAEYPLERAIFVFAGGINPSFERFDPKADPPSHTPDVVESHHEKVSAFVEQKGPDFISRLRGHINILEVNTESGRTKHLIRRAIHLRSFFVREKRLDENRVARIDNAIAYALLTVDRYRHGARSME